MHFVTGGAFNGKRKWVKTHYPHGCFISAYEHKRFEVPDRMRDSTLVFEGMEEWVRRMSDEYQTGEALLEAMEIKIKRLLDWEEAGVLPTKRGKHTLSKIRHKESRYFLR